MSWFKHHNTHVEQIASNKERDRKSRAHHLHMDMNEAQAETTEKSAASIAAPDAAEGLEPGFANKVGRGKQIAQQAMSQHSKDIGRMQARVRLGRQKSRSRGRSLGF